MAAIDRSHLEIVRAIDECGSLTAAAEHLFVTQPALSHSIRKLEDSLGVKLWNREGRNLQFTQAGKYLLGVAQRLLPQIERAEEQLKQYADGKSGTLRIGMECHPCYQWLLKIVAPYLKNWPSVELDVKQQFQFSGIDALLDTEIDLLVTPDPIFKAGLVFEPVFDYEQVLVVSPDHPLGEQEYVLPEQLANETIITYPVTIDRLDLFSQFLIPAGISPKQHKSIETTDIMLQMVASGRGVTALPRWLVTERSSRFSLRALALGKSGIKKQIHLGYRATDANVDYIKAFVDLANSTQQPCREIDN